MPANDTTSIKRKSPDKENQPPTLTLTEDQMEALKENPMVNSIFRKKIRKEMIEEEKRQIHLDALKELVEEAVKKEVKAVQTELDTLKTDHTTLKTDHITLKTDHITLKTDHATLKTEHTQLARIVYRVISEFAPATLIALYECSVYTFVQGVIPHSNPDLGLIRHQQVRLCNCVMVLLRTNFSAEQKKKMEIKEVPNTVGDRQTKLRLVLASLQGLKTYIQLVEPVELVAWNYDQRNQIMHGGSFLRCLFPPSSTDGDDAKKQYQEEVKRVTKFGKGIENAATLKGYHEDVANIEVAVMDIRAELTNKGVEVVDEKDALKLVKKVTHALSEDATVPQSDADLHNTQGHKDSKKKKNRQQKQNKKHGNQ